MHTTPTAAPAPSSSATCDRRTRLVRDNLKLVHHLARKMSRRAAPYLEVDDLVSIGAEALLVASQRYDEGRAVAFGSFAYLRVRGAMIEGLGQAGPVSRGLARKRRDRPNAGRSAPRLHAYDDARQTGGVTAPTHAELADRMIGGIDVGRLAPRVREVLAALDPTDRAFIERHYFGGESLLDIGKDLGVSKSWASRVHARALARLRAALEADAAGRRASQVG